MSDYEIERFEHAGRTVVIYTDPEPSNPRKEWDNVATIVYSHRNYILGDKEMPAMSADEMRETIPGIVAMLPVFAYIHSGVTIRCGAFADPWDSGQVGWIYVTKEALDKDGWAADARDAETLEKLLRAEIKTYDDYLTGSVYGFQVLGLDGEVIDSCWDFYGDLGEVRSEAKSSAKTSQDPAVVKAAEELAARATFAGGAL
jgi:hypothetical protein